MPRFHAAFGIASPANTMGTEASRPNKINPQSNNRADIFMRSLRDTVAYLNQLLRKTIFYIGFVGIQVPTKITQERFTTGTRVPVVNALSSIIKPTLTVIRTIFFLVLSFS